MTEDTSSHDALINELERSGTEPSAITTRPTAGPTAAPRKRTATPRELGQIVLVLQGGGALGAYQAGVYQALHAAGVEPDWVVGTSIGAINASLIAGNEPGSRLDRLEEFWRRVKHGRLQQLYGAWPLATTLMTISAGIPAFFRPNPLVIHPATSALVGAPFPEMGHATATAA